MEEQKTPNVEVEKEDSGSKLSDLSKSLKGSSEESSEKEGGSKKDLSSLHLKKITENFMALHMMARDFNVSRQNVQELVGIMGGDKKTGADAHFQSQKDKQKLLDSEIEKEAKELEEKKKTSPTKVDDEKKKKPGLFQKVNSKVKGKINKLKKKFTESAIVKKFTKYFKLAAIGFIIFSAFKDSILEWANGLWTTIKEKFDEFVDSIKEWFNDVVQPILDGIKEFLQPMIDAVSTFFEKIGNWFVEKFETIKGIFQPVFDFIGRVWEKFSAMIDEFKVWLKPKVEGAMKAPLVGSAVTKIVKSMGLDTFLGIGQKPQTVDPSEDAAEKKKLERQQKEAQDTQRVREQEKKAQYSGDDEIVRKRHGIQDKTTTMRAEEAKKPAGGGETAPTTTTPTPAPTGGSKEKPPSPSDSKPAKIGGETGKSAMLKAMDQHKITDPTMRAAIMAQVGHESGNFTMLSENLNYSASGLTKIFPKYFRDVDPKAYERQPAKIADRVYGGRMGNGPEGSGEGYKYRGRGFIQLTGKQNYTKFGFASNPDSVSEPNNAAETAIKYMMGYKGDWADIVKVTKFVNGGTIGLEDRKKHFQEYMNDPKITKVGAAGTATSGGAVSSASTELASGQRQQQKPSTPVVVNAPTTNNTVVNNNKSAPCPPPKNTAGNLSSRVA
jgi:putative chitinase